MSSCGVPAAEGGKDSATRAARGRPGTGCAKGLGRLDPGPTEVEGEEPEPRVGGALAKGGLGLLRGRGLNRGGQGPERVWFGLGGRGPGSVGGA